MAGRNRFHYNDTVLKSLSESREICVFISHRTLDDDAALAIAHYIVNRLNIDVYIDDDDRPLRTAVAAQNYEEIVRYIEKGIFTSTHLLAVLSSRTIESWWVPFEIGSARQKRLSIAYLLLEDVTYIPEYLLITTRLKDHFELNSWISNNLDSNIIRLKAYHPLQVPRLPQIRLTEPRVQQKRP